MDKSQIDRTYLLATLPPNFDGSTFHGQWTEKYWKNIPGPFYSTTGNMMSLLAFGNETANHLLYDDFCEFVWRQPVAPSAYFACLRGMDCDEVGSYAVDGNRHWTAELVREWWSKTPELLAWAEGHLLKRNDPAAFRQGYDVTDRNLFREYIRFLHEDAEKYLSSYIFLLSEGRPAKAGDTLPRL